MSIAYLFRTCARGNSYDNVLIQVRRVAAEFLALNVPLHGLVNNAGFLADKAVYTEDDIESTMAVAINGTFLLTGLLLPALSKVDAPVTGPEPNHPVKESTNIGRVINMSSGGQYLGRLDLHDLRGHSRFKESGTPAYDGTLAYVLAKKTQVALTQAYARQYPLRRGVHPHHAKDDATGHAANVVFHAMNPGWARTPGTAASIGGFEKIHGSMMRTPDEAADTAVWLCLTDDEKVTKESGHFWLDRVVVPTEMRGARTGYTNDDLDRLWTICNDICPLRMQ
jgi:dehydrogenase/reductase SDR family protein 12